MTTKRLDAVIIAGDLPTESAGGEVRDEFRLTLDGKMATLGRLKSYFQAGRDMERYRSQVHDMAPAVITMNAPYLCQYLNDRGIPCEYLTFFSLHKDRLLELEPRIVVISTTYLTDPAKIDQIAAFAKEHLGDVTVIAGGIKIYKSYRKRELARVGWFENTHIQDIARDNYFIDEKRPSPVDFFVISNRGEYTLSKLIEGIRQNADCRRMDNIAYYEEGRWHVNPVVPEPSSEIRVDWRRVPLYDKGAYIPVQAGVGCRFKCAFCDFWELRPLEQRTVESIVDEIRSAPEYEGVRRINFVDDNLFASRQRIKQFCGALIDSGMPINWRGFMRVDSVDEEAAELISRSGGSEVLLGVESGDATMLKFMNKGSTPEGILSGVRLLNQYGINTLSTLVVGFPGETHDTVRNTIDLINSYETSGPGMCRFSAFVFTNYPLTRAASPEFRKRFNLQGYLSNWSHATMDVAEAHKQVRRMHDAIKLDVSPYYVEVGELPTLPRPDRKQACYLRNRIVRHRRGLLPEDSEDRLWNELEAALSAA